jgi:hypothetical protein
MKYRVTTWWWGNYITKISGHWVDEDGVRTGLRPPEDMTNQKPGWPQWEEYREDLHGAHNQREV